jgi:hypothetical protein
LAGVQLAPVEQELHEPLSQTWPVPHAVPLAACVPVSVHTATPVEQSVEPVSHGLDGVHAAPCVHEVHAPLSHTLLVPHAVPFAALVPVSVHTAAPVEQSVVPAWHALVGAHEAPCVHEAHAPLSHTLLVPHAVPFAALVPVSVHTAVPVEQSVVPVWHALVGVHEAPWVHEVHVPLSQTWLTPHTVPLAACVPVSVHVGVPPEQEIVPVSHELVGTHEAPLEHAAQTPVSHTFMDPHDVPSGRLLFEFVHTDAPVEQTVDHTVQELAGVQSVPAVHALHAPALHTMFTPHELPSASVVPVSVHVAAPVEQSVVPVWHALVGTQATPCVHALHAPLSQTWLVPHVVPLVTLVPVSRHVSAPMEQSVTPVWQGTATGVHAAPVEQPTQAPLSQALPVPQAVPLAAVMCVSMHSGEPIVRQSRMPRSHALAGVQAAPGMHTPPSEASEATLSRPVSSWLVSARPVSTIPVSTAVESARASMPPSVVAS